MNIHVPGFPTLRAAVPRDYSSILSQAVGAVCNRLTPATHCDFISLPSFVNTLTLLTKVYPVLVA